MFLEKEVHALRLRGRTIVFLDWANIYGWTKSLKSKIDPQELFEYLSSYSKIQEIRFYFGKDSHQKSQRFLEEIQRIGYKVISKPVKYIFVAEIENEKIFRRKCDFDMEICIDTHDALQKDFESFLFFTGDGDFEPLYKMLIRLKKQVIVVFAEGHLGKEIHQMRKGIYKKDIRGLSNLCK